MKHINDYMDYDGMDDDNAVSLFEYGLLWTEMDDDENYKFIYGILNEGEKYTRFDFRFFTFQDWENLCKEGWFKLEEVSKFSDMTKEDFVKAFPFTLQDALNYHGYQNIFGESYSGGFEIEE